MSDGTLLNVDGAVQAAGATQVAITGSTGTNTVLVGAAGALFATAELGDGADVLDVFGTLDTGASVFNLGADGDLFAIHDGTLVTGIIDCGTGTDALTGDIATTATLGSAINFETLTKTNVGTLTVAGPAPSDFVTVNVLGGTLDVGAIGSLNGVQSTTIAAGATINVDGS